MGKKSKKGQSRAGGKKNYHKKNKTQSVPMSPKKSSATATDGAGANGVDPAAAAAVAKALAAARAQAQAEKLAEVQAQALAAAAANADANASPMNGGMDIMNGNGNGNSFTTLKMNGNGTMNGEAVTDTSSAPSLVPPPPPQAMMLPDVLSDSIHLLTPSQIKLASQLCSSPTNQSHIFASWADKSTPDEKKVELISQLERMDKAYPSGGLVGYIENAKVLLERSRKGVNPLDGWKPSVPQGENFEIGTEEYDFMEKVGMTQMGKCGFVLVAGGLGERLGYSGIKVCVSILVYFGS